MFRDLNDKQIKAVQATSGPVLVIAGAGSGKTRALTSRIAYLIREKRVRPFNILAVTFTNKAANEMRDRLINLLGNDSALPVVGTFHSVCVRILRKHIHLLDYENQFSIYDATDQEILVKRIMKELGIDDEKIKPRAILSHISAAKNELVGPAEYRRIAHTYFNQQVADVYERYQKALQTSNALDFDDLIMKTVELFEKHLDVLDQYQEKFMYISVDEYQDTNHAQYTLTNLLARKYRNLCVIGDPDQSIYSWRGANMRNILDFEKDYPDACVIKMEQNYRSTKKILEGAHHVIVKNKRRKDKKLWTENADGAHVKILETRNERSEGEVICETIELLARAEGAAGETDYKKFVVLYRTNAQSRVLEEVFLRFGIPYKIIGGVRFYERKEIKDMLAYLRVLVNVNDDVSLLRIINVPPRKIGAKTIESVQRHAMLHNISFWGALRQAGDIDDMGDAKADVLLKFVGQIRKLQDVSKTVVASAVIRHVIDTTGYKEFLEQDGSVEAEARLQNILELVSVASKYDTLEPGVSLDIFLEEVSLIADIDSLTEKDNSVTLMTLHAAKGLEFPHVFMAGMEEGIFPHSRSLLDPEQLEEERRLMYVGMTRAKERLCLLYARERMLYGESQSNAPSQFLHDIPLELVESNAAEFGGKVDTGKIGGFFGRLKKIPIEFGPEAESDEPYLPAGGRRADGFRLPVRDNDERRVVADEEAASNIPLIELAAGDRVRHRSFGDGTVVALIGGVVTIAFADPRVGVKKLALSVAPLEKL